MGFRCEWLPPAEVFFRDNVEKFRARSRRATGLCPFHPDKNASLSLDLNLGLFNCFACGASGGDVVDFVRLRDSCSFKTACRTLGCWDDQGQPESYKPLPTVPERWLVLDYVIDGVPYRAEVRDEPRTDLQRTRRFYFEAADRLAALRQGDREEFDGETEAQWGILAASSDSIQMEGR